MQSGNLHRHLCVQMFAMREKPSRSESGRENPRHIRFEAKPTNRVGEVLRKAFGEQHNKEENAQEFDRLLGLIN